ncbi:DUF4349 domain-containing protein [Actinophytocola sp.]|uniref:DUF4349 domain-containing protein n=1 Tax=Actinophytocola sp. TaxID=1872138 RepID=UPI002D7FB0A5|nr:DUF4349 domain-containing protein [Actinophytocola sp.]HET9137864.1 DUF4349 domain-containing protein [Actinophytocola sp.]
MNTRRWVGLAGLLLAGGVLAGCSADPETTASSGGSAADAVAPAAPEQANAANPPAKADGSAPQPQQQQQVSQPGVDRKLIRTAELELVSPDVAGVATRAREVAINRGGFAGQEEVRGSAASITLHIPSDQFDKAVAELSGLVPAENISSRTMSSEDVTEQLVDVESRITTQRSSVERVRALLARAQTVDEIVRIESEVTRREADLESLEKRRETLAGRVGLSRVTVRVTRGEAAPPPAEDKSGFLAALAGGWNAFLTAGGVVLEVIGALLPFLVVLGIPGVLLYRWWRRRPRPAGAPVPEAKA